MSAYAARRRIDGGGRDDVIVGIILAFTSVLRTRPQLLRDH